MATQEGAAPLFAIFFLAVYSLILIPVTIYKLCNPSEEAVKPWEAGSQRKPSKVLSYFRRVGKGALIALAVAWALWIAIVLYVQVAAKDIVPFDPFEILGVSHSASKQEVSSAYRKLALRYHPDRNPDPAAGEYFAEYVNKAYKALTDKTARENYEKYGHPDGPQAVRLLPVVALPEWVLSGRGKAPWVLAALVFGGIMLPLIVAAYYLMNTRRSYGPNQVMPETIEVYLRHPKISVKESQSLARIPDTLIMAYEFLLLPTPAEQAEGLEELRKIVLRVDPSTKDNKQAWFKKRKSSLVKAHMLLLAHLEREPIPATLAADHRMVITKCILLLEEMIKIANLPRVPGVFAGWLAPTLGSLEMMQCITQAVPLSARKNLGTAGKAGAESGAVLLQVPHMTPEVQRKLTRSKRAGPPVRSSADLLALDAEQRMGLLHDCGLATKKPLIRFPGLNLQQAAEASTALAAMPTVSIQDAQLSVEGQEGDIVKGDVVALTCLVQLHRASHARTAFKAPAEGGSVQMYAPHYPGTRQERWWFVLANVAANAVLAVVPVSLLRAEAAGVAASLSKKATADTVSGGSDSDTQQRRKNGRHAHGSEESFQEVVLRFPAPQAGKYDLLLLCVSDCWLGCDVAVPVKLRVAEQSRAQLEGREAKPGRHPAALDRPPFSDDEAEADPDAEEEEEEEDDGVSGEWDSEETGTAESGADSEADEKLPLKSGQGSDAESSSTAVRL